MTQRDKEIIRKEHDDEINPMLNFMEQKETGMQAIC